MSRLYAGWSLRWDIAALLALLEEYTTSRVSLRVELASPFQDEVRLVLWVEGHDWSAPAGSPPQWGHSFGSTYVSGRALGEMCHAALTRVIEDCQPSDVAHPS